MTLTNTKPSRSYKGDILVVDDTPDNLRSLSALLTTEGYRVRKAISGEMALETIQVAPPDLLLLDINMPSINGYEVCQRLKANPQTLDIPVIFLSAYNQPVDIVKALRVGGVDYITKPFNIEEVLARVETHLRMRQMQLELQQAKADALRALEQERELNRLKSEFVSMLCHDFRTPLASIQGFAGLLRHGREALSPEQQQRYFSKIDAAVEQLMFLLDKVLLIGSKDAGAIECHPAAVDLNIFCNELIETLRLNTNNSHEIAFTCTGNCNNVAIDETLLLQILTNLLSNAMKYSPTGSTVQLHVHGQDDEITFRIQDQGIGIPAESLPHLFDTFYRCNNVGRIPGTGLGLSVVKTCVDAHNGQIKIDSQENVGTTVTITLLRGNSIYP